MRTEEPYNPLDKTNLGVSVADAMLERPVVEMPLAESFIGAGIYAIYYTGKFPAYSRIAEKNRKNNFGWPIYVGKAVPKGSRRGGFDLGASPGMALHKRLQKHAESIEQAENLNIKDFHCRYIAVDDIWIPLGESLLIERFYPLWNRCLDGFGNNVPGKGRLEQKRPQWDVIHPGRTWASKLRPNEKSEAELLALVERFIEEHHSNVS